MATSDNSAVFKNISRDERERSSLIMLLSGLGLREDEMLLFENENIGVETFMSLSDDDLLQMGIEDPEKRKSIMKIVFNLRRRGTKKQEEVKRLEPLSWKDASSVMENNSQYMGMLHGVLQYLQAQERHRKKRLYAIDGFLDKDWTCSRALLACAAAAVSQSQCVCKELENLKVKLAGGKDEQNRKWSVITKRSLKLITAGGMGILGGFVMWRTAKALLEKET